MSKLLETKDFRLLTEKISLLNPRYIVLEGYNAVGKSVILERLVENSNYRVYRPDYNKWANRIPREYRWAIFGSYMNIADCVDSKPSMPVLLDRGFFSGVVYNNDMSLPLIYNNIVGDLSKDILHVLITCNEEDYSEFLRVRNSQKPLYYQDCLEYTQRYEEAFNLAGANYLVYQNVFDKSKCYENYCIGCSHYTFHDNQCHNVLAIKNGISNVSPYRVRCEYSVEKEVQDSGELHELSAVSE